MEPLPRIPIRTSLSIEVFPDTVEDFTAVPAEDQHLENLYDSFFIDFSYAHFFQRTRSRSSRIPIITFNDIFIVDYNIISICHHEHNLSLLIESFRTVPLPSKVLEAVLDRVVTCGIDMLVRNNVNGEGQQETLRIHVDLEAISVPLSEESGGDQFAHATVLTPVNSLKKVSVDDDPGCASETCSICLEKFEESDRVIVRTLHCSHVFHEDCIQGWFDHDLSCPNCRQLP